MHLVLLPLAHVPVPPTVQVSALAPSFLIDDRESLQFRRPGSGLNLDFIPKRARLPHTSDALLIRNVRRLGCVWVTMYLRVLRGLPDMISTVPDPSSVRCSFVRSSPPLPLS
ncbi:hypothetical protein OH76DRAFT_1402087 [Lentinus brumalis]|uniref:Uncharacterized protein n=1 Tax=Lentinus brumalis TaxID=2498619 RepID=A0A371DEC8_9APHY|nr:hypothetical protein OH76DRAFT_1402087 [Polyporus brumalis]